MDRLRFEALIQARERKQSEQKYRSDFIHRIRGIDQPGRASSGNVAPFDYKKLYQRFCNLLTRIENEYKPRR